MTTRHELLEAAARCYLRAGDQGDACRCFESVGQWGDAAILHENAGRLPEAAAAYERAGKFLDAARCYRAAGALHGEARCLSLAGEKLRAAWILVHELGRAREAQEMLEGAPGGSRMDAAGALLVLARCDAARGERNAAARRVREVLAALPEIASGPSSRRMVEWALAVCEALRRPDLGALVISAVGEAAGGAEVMWDQWAQRTFGEDVPPPVALVERERDPVADAEGEGA